MVQKPCWSPWDGF